MIDVAGELRNFLKIIEEVKIAHDHLPAMVEKCNLKTTDYLHDIELNDLSYHEIGKLQKAQVKNLKERRKYKDELEIYTPLAEFFKTPDGRALKGKIEKILGETRHIMEKHKIRTYNRRVDDEGRITKITQ